MTSIERLTGRRVPLPEIAARMAHHAGQVYERELVAVDGASLTASPAG